MALGPEKKVHDWPPHPAYTRSAEEQFLSTQVTITQFCDTLVLTTSSSSSSATSSSLTLFRLSHFLTRFLGFLVLFSNSPSSTFGYLSRGPASAWPSQEQYDPSGLEPDGPPWASWAFSAFGRLFQGPASRLTVPRTIWSEWSWSEQSTLACSTNLLECLLGWLMYPVYFFKSPFIVHISCILTCFSFLPLFSQIFIPNVRFS